MGTWGPQIFDNDAACDLAGGIAHTEAGSGEAEELILGALKPFDAAAEGWLVDEALAAADIVARLRGHFGQRDGYTGSIDRWVRKQRVAVTPEMVSAAQAAVANVLQHAEVFAARWTHPEVASEWLDYVRALQARLGSPAVH